MTLIFLHIPKAGGSTFNEILKREFHNKNTYQLKFNDIEKFKAHIKKNKPHIDLLKGHLPFGLHELFSDQTRYITFLRSPTSRVISYYNYILDTPSHYLYSKVAKKEMPIEDFVISDLTTEIDNGQVRFLSSTNDSKHQISENTLEIAKNNLDLYFEVGITEKFDKSLICFFERKILVKSPLYVKANVARKAKKKVGKNIIDLIEKRNIYDIALYTYGNKILEDRIKEIPNFDNKLDEFIINNIEYLKKNGGFWYQIPTILKRQFRKIFY